MVSPARRRFPIVLLSDFGYRDHYTGVMKGVIASIAPEASVIDLTHGIPAQSVAAGAIALAGGWRFFSQETIFFVVGAPRVGTQRGPVSVESPPRAPPPGPQNGVCWAPT